MNPLLRFARGLFESNKPPAREFIDESAIESIASGAPAEARRSAALRAPATFRHPRANREARLGEVVVAYEFTRSQRRTIGFVVGVQGLVVRAPKWVPLRQVDAALQSKAGWIIDKLAAAAERDQKQVAGQIEWRDGTVLPFLGATVRVALDPLCLVMRRGAVSVVLQPADAAASDVPGTLAPRTLLVGLPADATPAHIQGAVQAWLMRQAKQVFIERLDHFAPQLQVQWRTLALSNARTRWGSARTDGAIRLNWRLIHFRLPVIDYVVAHELSHLREMNHSARFWDTVRSVVPDYAALRKQLKEEAVPRWS